MRLAQTLLFLSYFESGTLYSRHVNSIRAIRHVRHLLPESTALTLACSLINSRLDYCSALLYGAPVSTISKLQRVQNNAAHVVVASSRRCDAKPLLRQLHWLPVRQRILYKTATWKNILSDTLPPTRHVLLHVHCWLSREQILCLPDAHFHTLHLSLGTMLTYYCVTANLASFI